MIWMNMAQSEYLEENIFEVSNHDFGISTVLTSPPVVHVKTQHGNSDLVLVTFFDTAASVIVARIIAKQRSTVHDAICLAKIFNEAFARAWRHSDNNVTIETGIAGRFRKHNSNIPHEIHTHSNSKDCIWRIFVVLGGGVFIWNKAVRNRVLQDLLHQGSPPLLLDLGLPLDPRFGALYGSSGTTFACNGCCSCIGQPHNAEKAADEKKEMHANLMSKKMCVIENYACQYRIYKTKGDVIFSLSQIS